ncbi:MAG TPA: hypothetical protein DDZ80_16125 [Cyanobacteria bacterium UBA8803]|nr:hypothetical protein [Cyanobacteria bacterium UBA9273]HBL59943.1 hypothetical protein [Cyanobacteria bacterium UBA8803]
MRAIALARGYLMVGSRIRVFSLAPLTPQPWGEPDLGLAPLTPQPWGESDLGLVPLTPQPWGESDLGLVPQSWGNKNFISGQSINRRNNRNV